jgi:hypothetical protein
VEPAQGPPLDDGSDQRVGDRLERDVAEPELLRDEGERRAGGLAHAQRQVPRLPPHGDDEIPARGRVRVGHQVLDDLGAEMTGGLEPERVHVRGQGDVVVDGLRHVDHVDPAGRLLFEPHRRICGVVAADGDQVGHVEPQQREDGVLEQLGVGRGVGPGDADDRAAA